ncbi:MAG TPA: sialidase family protein [Phycisphaerae bacterium]|nr:sialidase family protein [Phycisphaerae bacterium]
MERKIIARESGRGDRNVTGELSCSAASYSSRIFRRKRAGNAFLAGILCWVWALPGAAQQLLSVQKIWDQAPHNAFTDLVLHNGAFYCCFREGDGHVSLPASARILRSTDGQTWTPAALLASPTEDYRDPHLTVAPDNRLMLYLASRTDPPVNGITHRNYAFFSTDGSTWTDRVEIGEPNIWLWRITWHQNVAYGIGYSWTSGAYIRLYQSTNGVHFDTLVPDMGVPVEPNETSRIIFMPDGKACVLAREGAWGTAYPPYTQWSWLPLGFSVGGPEMLRLPDGRFIAATRLYDGVVRTALSWINPTTGAMTECLSLPSGGDTSYPGLVWRDDILWVSYYSSHEGKASIYLAKVAFPQTPTLCVQDTFSRPDSDPLGMTEAPEIPWIERTTLGSLWNVAQIKDAQLWVFGSEGNAPTASGPGAAVLDIDLRNLLISADVRFSLENPIQAAGRNTGGFMLRKPRSDASIGDPSSAGQITIQLHPSGGLYVGQMTTNGSGLATLFADNPFTPGLQDFDKIHVFQGAGGLPRAINGQSFDTDGDGVLETSEPFRLEAVLVGQSLDVKVNGQSICATTVAGESSSPSNFLALFKNRWTNETNAASSHVLFDNLLVLAIGGNDSCSQAPAISHGVTLGTTHGATNDGQSPCDASPDPPDVWYSYTAPITGDLAIDTCGADINTTLSVLDECGGRELGCSRLCPEGPCPASDACLLVPVAKGRSYLIRVASTDDSRGRFDLNVQTRIPTVLTHRGMGDPLLEMPPWTLDANAVAPDAVMEPGDDGQPHWRIAIAQGWRANYQYRLSPLHWSDPRGWTLTARVRAATALGLYQSYLEVNDDRDAWMISLVTPGGLLDPGLWTNGLALEPLQHLAAFDPAAEYHTYQMVYAPAADQARGAVLYYMDGRMVGIQSRTEALDRALTRVVWGDNDSGGIGGSDSRWAFVRFELGQRPLPPCSNPSADADADGDVDQEDFGAFQRCYAGKANPVEEACSCFDADYTGTVDAADLAAFIRCVSSPTVLADPRCDG